MTVPAPPRPVGGPVHRIVALLVVVVAVAVAAWQAGRMVGPLEAPHPIHASIQVVR